MSTLDKADLSVTKGIDNSPDQVYDAWLDPKVARKFLFATERGTMVRAEIDPRVGGRFTMTDRRDGDDFEHAGEYIVLDRPKQIVFDFWLPKFSEERTRIQIDIAANGGKSSLTLTHRDVPPGHRDKARNGWMTILSALGNALA